MRHNRRRNERGASLVEYALLVTLIALACLSALSVLGGSNEGSVEGSASKIGSAVGIPYP